MVFEHVELEAQRSHKDVALVLPCAVVWSLGHRRITIFKRKQVMTAIIVIFFITTDRVDQLYISKAEKLQNKPVSHGQRKSSTNTRLFPSGDIKALYQDCLKSLI
jgi:hypothetical protein